MRDFASFPSLLRFPSFLTALLALSAAAPATGTEAAAPRSHKGESVVRLQLPSAPEARQSRAAELLVLVEASNSSLSFWEGTDVHATASGLPAITAFCSHHDVGCTPLIPDVQALLDQQRAARSGDGVRDLRAFHDSFHTFDEIHAWLEGVATRHPQLASLVQIGSSYEGRPLLVLHIAPPNRGGDSPSDALRPRLWLQSLLHAREWLTGAISLWLIEHIISQYGTDAAVTALVDSIDLYIMPVANPDGYAYSHTNNFNARFWRKSRSPNAGSRCVGTDLNRNFDHQWSTIGTSSSKCSDIYHGSAPASEVEVQAIQAFVMAGGSSWKVFMDSHAYSQMWFVPWGYTGTLPVDHEEQLRVARLGRDALTAVHGTQFELGTGFSTIYPTSGTADDWSYGVAGIVHSACTETRDTGRYGFLAPAEEIFPASEEYLAGVIAYATAAVAPPLVYELTVIGNARQGERATFKLIGGAPSAKPIVVYSLKGLGSTNVPQLGVTLGVKQPTQLSVPTKADRNGAAEWSMQIPANAPIGPVVFQALKSGSVSNVVEAEILPQRRIG